MQECPASHGVGEGIKNGHGLVCPECAGSSQTGVKDDPIAAAYVFFSELEACHRPIQRLLHICWYLTVLSAIFIDFAAAVLLLPLAATASYAYLSKRHDPAEFRTFGQAKVMLLLAWIVFGLLFVLVLLKGPLFWWSG